MGNKALRRELGQRLKELGWGKLYKGNRRTSYRFLRAAHMKNMLQALSYQKGDLVHDCDGFNHVVEEPIVEQFSRCNVWVAYVKRVVFDDGSESCGCSAPDPAYTQENIEAFFKAYLQDGELAANGWTGSLFDQELKKRLDAGEHIADERGLVLPELKQFSRGMPVQ